MVVNIFHPMFSDAHRDVMYKIFDLEFHSTYKLLLVQFKNYGEILSSQSTSM